MPEKLSDLLSQVPAGLPAVDWAPVEQIRHRARVRTRRRVAATALAVVALVAATFAIATHPGGVRIEPIGPPSGTPPASGQPFSPDASPAPVATPLSLSVLLDESDLPAAFVPTGAAMTMGPGYLGQGGDWPVIRFQPCPSFPPVTSFRSQEVRVAMPYFHHGVEQTASPEVNGQWIVNGEWVERHPDAAAAAQAVADIRTVVEVCGAYPKIAANVRDRFAGDQSYAFTETTKGGAADEDGYWTVVRVGRFVAILRLTGDDTDLSTDMADRICTAYPDECR